MPFKTMFKKYPEAMKTPDADFDDIKNNMESAIAAVRGLAQSGKCLDELEACVVEQMRALGRQVLEAAVNETAKKKDDPESIKDLIYKGYSPRMVQTSLGRVLINRRRYALPGGGRGPAFPFDKAHKISSSGFSLRLLDLLGLCASSLPFEQAAGTAGRFLGLELSGMQAERALQQLSASAEGFYGQLPEPPAPSKGQAAIASYDGKAIPMRVGEMGREAAGSAQKIGKGQKRDTKRCCSVSVVYVAELQPRTAESVISSLFDTAKPESGNSRETPRTQMRGFLGGKARAASWGAAQAARLAQGAIPTAVLIDGEAALEKSSIKASEIQGIAPAHYTILDFIHVIQYVWKAANAQFGEKGAGRDAWARGACLSILTNGPGEILKELNRFASQELSDPKKKAFTTVIQYINNHAHMMDYPTYLAEGYPIATGAVESACGHYVKSRMDCGGMRWTVKGAQDVLDVRSINKNQLWGDFIKYHAKSA
jgi:hypothetical protein